MRNATPIPVHRRDWLTSGEVMLIFGITRWSVLKHCRKGRLRDEVYRQAKDRRDKRRKPGVQYSRWCVPKYAVREMLLNRRAELLSRLKGVDEGIALLEAMDWPME